MTRTIPTALARRVPVTPPTIILVVSSAEIAKAIQQAQAWFVKPESGMGRVTVRVVIAPPEVTTDEAWLFTQLAEAGITDIDALQEATLIRW